MTNAIHDFRNRQQFRLHDRHNYYLFRAKIIDEMI